MEFVLGSLGELQALGVHFFSGFQQVQGVVTDALEVADCFQQNSGLVAVLFADLQGAELHQVSTQDVFIVVGLVLASPDGGSQFGGQSGEGGYGSVEGSGSALGHFLGQVVAVLQGNGGSGQQTFIQLGDLFGLLGIGDQLADQLLQQAAAGEQNSGTYYVKGGVANGNTQVVGAFHQNSGLHHFFHDPEDGQQEQGADGIEHQVQNGGPAGVFGGTYGGQQGGDGGTDILAHDDGDSCTVADSAGGGQGLQNTDRCGGGLNNTGQHSAGQDTQDGVGEHQEHVRKPGGVLQILDGTGHGVHTEHQNGEAQENGANILLLAIMGEHLEEDTNEGQDGRKGGGLEKLQEQAVTFDAAQGQDPGGDGGTDVGAHDDADGLGQIHQAGVNEADDHNGGGGGGLDHSGDRQTCQEAQQAVGGQLAQQAAQAVSGSALQAFAHQVHAEQEQAQAANHG